jgi:ParB-like chromosome segregation protein Spo0J
MMRRMSRRRMMSELEVQVPPVELVSVEAFRTDKENPNRVFPRQFEALKKSIQRFGFVVPIITNRDLLIADGEHRLEAARALGMKQVSVVRLPVDEVDRRLLRQVMNKLRGEHDSKLDAEEFQRIVNAGHEDDLKKLLVLSDQSVKTALKHLREDEGNTIFRDIWEVVVECASEHQQEETYKKLVEQGYRCRVLTL